MITLVSTEGTNTNGEVLCQMIQILSGVLPAVFSSWTCFDRLIKLSQLLNIFYTIHVLSMFQIIVAFLVKT